MGFFMFLQMLGVLGAFDQIVGHGEKIRQHLALLKLKKTVEKTLEAFRSPLEDLNPFS